MDFLTKKELKKYMRLRKKALKLPVPQRMMTNGEYHPKPQTKQQKEVEARLKEKADTLGKKMGMNRREFLRSASGMAAAFLAMNEVHGHVFNVDPAEAADIEMAEAVRAGMRGQFILDDQTHFVRDDYAWEGLNFLREFAKGNNPEKTPWNRALVGSTTTLADYHFDKYLKAFFLESDTTVPLISNATFDDPEKWLISDETALSTRDTINSIAGTTRMLGHALFWPGHPGNEANMERISQTLKPSAWKGYTVGDPLGPSEWPWMMDDEKLTYPSYQIAEKYGVRNICIHKGLMPDNYEQAFPTWKYAHTDDIPKAAKDWPGLNFVIYHSAIRPLFDCVQANDEFEKTGKLPWIDEVSEMNPAAGINNVYGEIGSSFAMTVITYPRMCAYLLGRLITGLGADHVVWGTDSIWYGSPQWQIEAMRRIEIPNDMQDKFGFMPLGPADGAIKNGILGLNSARIYSLGMMADGKPVEDYQNDGIAQMQAEYRAAGKDGDKFFHSWLAKQDWSRVEIAAKKHQEFRAQAAKTYVARNDDSKTMGGFA